MEKNPEKWLLLVDWSNAYNSMNRKAGLEEVARIFPEILEWIKTCYSSSSNLLFGNCSIFSDTGWHQGDPLDSLLFALGLHPILLMIREEVPTLLLNAWFQDDGTEVGSQEELQQVVDILEREGSARGLTLSTTSSHPKCVVWSPCQVGGD